MPNTGKNLNKWKLWHLNYTSETTKTSVNVSEFILFIIKLNYC